MKTLIYDGSLEGLFTAVFEVFEYTFGNPKIVSENNYSPDFFSETHLVYTSKDKADRVLKKLENTIGDAGVQSLICVYLSESRDREKLILHAVQRVLKDTQALADFGDTLILEIAKIRRSVGREKHRMEAFVRFEKLQDEIFFAKIDPDFDVLPLIRKHFMDRYQDQKWLIYDLRRHYALFYDLNTCDFFTPEADFTHKVNHAHHESEDSYQKLWQTYFQKTNIKERANTKLHIQHVPKRYWKYLTEKVE